jgi:hypothetical protein
MADETNHARAPRNVIQEISTGGETNRTKHKELMNRRPAKERTAQTTISVTITAAETDCAHMGVGLDYTVLLASTMGLALNQLHYLGALVTR